MHFKFKRQYLKILAKLNQNPKNSFKWMMIIGIVSMVWFAFSYFYFPHNKLNRLPSPPAVTSSKPAQKPAPEKPEQIRKIVEELKALKEKRETSMLTKEDTLRIKYLYNQYKTLTNETK